MVTVREEWLDLVAEEPLNPDLPICDPHHHLWEYPNNRYLLKELMQDIGGGHRVTQTVFVECAWAYRDSGPEEMRPVGETEFVQEVALQSASGPTGVAAAIVSFADLTLGDKVTPVLEAHIEAGKDRFRGIRHRTAWDGNPEVWPHEGTRQGLIMDRKFREGFARLDRLGLVFDAWVFHPQMPELGDLAQTFPNVPIILDHVGTPLLIGPYGGKRPEVIQKWKGSITSLATYPNVTVKLGGLGMGMCGFGWDQNTKPPTSAELARAMSPYILHCIEQFGPERCMFESNFPVDKASYSYTVMWNAFKRISQGFSPTEQAALFQGTAARVYRLPPDR